jgi:cell division protein FtsI/penicillin-binding protein 2
MTVLPTGILNELRQAQAARVARWGKCLLLMIALGMVGLLGRVVQLKLMPDPRLKPAVGAPISTRTEMTRRGDLYDRYGRVIATSTVGYRLFVDPGMAEDPSTIAIDLARILNDDAVALDRKITERSSSRYVVIRDLLRDWQVESIRKANLKGVGLEPRLVRHYPHLDLGAGVIGKVGVEHTGLTGFERIFDKTMLPSNGKLTFLRDVRRQALWIDPHDYEPGRDGQNVRLSLDLVVQEFAEKRLRRAVEEFNAGGGRMIVMDSRTGEILAMCDVLNARPGWKEQTEDKYRSIHPALGRNRCVTDPYEPGSTFKPFVWAVATELGKATLDEVLPLPEGPWRTPYGRTIRDAHYYGPSTWRKVLVKSMNAGMAMVAERMTHKEMQDAVRRFGFGSPVNCGLQGETAGIITPAKRWRTYTQTSVAIGQEIAVTPLQMVRAFSAFAREDGTMVQPRIEAVSAAQSDALHDDPALQRHSQPRRVISPSIVAVAREAMKGVMEEGTGRLAQSEKYQLFGKSGTAQLPKRSGKGYWQDRYVSSFIAGAPYAQPRIIVLCVLDDPDKRKGHFGGSIAGPVVRDVIDETLTYLGVPQDSAGGSHLRSFANGSPSPGNRANLLANTQ